MPDQVNLRLAIADGAFFEVVDCGGEGKSHVLSDWERVCWDALVIRSCGGGPA